MKLIAIRWSRGRKLLAIMKLTVFILLVVCTAVQARTGYGQKISLSEDGVPLIKVFRQIEKQTHYQFLFFDGDLKKAHQISLHVKNKPLQDVLHAVFKNQPLTYTINDKIIVVKHSPLALSAPADVRPNLEITGQVRDSATGASLAGVTVSVKGQSTGTVTDAAGEFTLEVPEGAILVVSYVGYNPQEIAVGGKTDFDIALSAATTGLNQLVVVGYGTQKKKDLTSAISTIKAEDLEKVEATSFTGAIEGKVPGVFVSGTGGAPGSASSVRIRGISTTGGNQPLYVVDGIPLNGGTMGIPGGSGSVDGMSIINPADIASVEVLKDASASAIYGSRAANGVILITTKRGKAGEMDINFKASTGFSQIWRKPDFLNAQEFASMANELYTNSGLTPNPEWADPAALGKGTDMVGLIFRNAPRQNYNLAFSGGSEKLSGRVSLGYTNQEGTIIETSFKRYTGRAAFDLKTDSRFHFGGSLAFAITESKGQNTNAMQGGLLNLATQFFPTLNPDSAFYGDALYYTKDGDNPILRAKTIDNRLHNFRIFGNVFGTYEIIPGLMFKTNVGLDGDFNQTSAWQGKIHRGFYNHAQATLSERYTHGLMWDIENTLSYSKHFGANSLSVVIGQSGRKSQNNWIGADGREYLNESLQVINTSDVSLRQASGTNGTSTIASYFGRVNYSLKDRYLFSASLRRDGSSNFGPNNKWGYFPSVSAGWRLTDEPFMQGLKDVVNNLKLRASWGRVGNDNIPAFGYLTTVQYGANYNLGINQDIVTGTYMSKPGNPNLKWETNEQIDIGLDASFMEEKMYLTLDYYVKNTIGMLVSLPVSVESGFQNSPSVNGGEVQNKGLEVSLGYQNNFGDFHFNVNGNVSTLKNVVKSLGVGHPIVGGGGIPNFQDITYTKVGEPIGYFRGYIVEGIYQTDAAVDKALQPGAVPGDFIYRDVDGDGELTEADKVKIGKPWPDFTYGLNISCAYKGFDFNLLLQGVCGNEIFDANKASNYQMKYFNGNGIVNGVKDILNHWTPGSGINDNPGLKFTDGNGNFTNPSSWYVENGSYARIRNVVLGYNIPVQLVEQTHVFDNVRIYLSVQNLFTFTSYAGFDPEVGSYSPLNAGIDTGVYPKPRTFNAGININF